MHARGLSQLPDQHRKTTNGIRHCIHLPRKSTNPNPFGASTSSSHHSKIFYLYSSSKGCQLTGISHYQVLLTSIMASTFLHSMVWNFQEPEELIIMFDNMVRDANVRCTYMFDTHVSLLTCNKPFWRV